MNDVETSNGRAPNGGQPHPPAPTEPLTSGKGALRNFQAEEGFGFIARYGEPDVFFHVSDPLCRDQRLCALRLQRVPGTLNSLLGSIQSEALVRQ